MTIAEKLRLMSDDDLAEFLYRFARDVIHNFSNFMLPDKESIMNMLEKEIPGGE